MSVAKLFFGLIGFFIKLGILLIILLVVALFVANNTIPPYSKHQEKAAEFLKKMHGKTHLMIGNILAIHLSTA